MGLRSSKTCMVTLDGARVPKTAMLGEEGKGFAMALATLDHSRLGIAAQSVGIATAALEESLRYARDRKQFGKPIMEHQAIAFQLADMDTEIDAARALLMRAVWAARPAGSPHPRVGGGQALSPRRCATASSARRSRSTAAMVSHPSTRLNGSSATPGW